jgi:predicted Zn finger-like uncharacterized protein
MSDMHIECPTCGWKGEIDDSHAGREVKCPKCKAPFTAETGEAYDLADSSLSLSSPTPVPPQASASAPAQPASEAPDPEEPEKQPWKSWLEEWPRE